MTTLTISCNTKYNYFIVWYIYAKWQRFKLHHPTQNNIWSFVSEWILKSSMDRDNKKRKLKRNPHCLKITQYVVRIWILWILTFSYNLNWPVWYHYMTASFMFKKKTSAKLTIFFFASLAMLNETLSVICKHCELGF